MARRGQRNLWKQWPGMKITHRHCGTAFVPDHGNNYHASAPPIRVVTFVPWFPVLGAFPEEAEFRSRALSRWQRWKMNRLLILRSTCPRLSAPNMSEPHVKPTLQLR